jgi:hypothetical protein
MGLHIVRENDRAHVYPTFRGKLAQDARLSASECREAAATLILVAAELEDAAHLQDLAERLDVSADSIKAFGFAAKGAGIDLDTAAHALGLLQRNLGQAELGGKGKGGDKGAAFRKLGIDIKDAAGHARPLNDVLLDVSEKFAGLPDQQQRAAYAMQMFGREGRLLVPVLAQGREKLKELFAESRELGSGLGGDFYKRSKLAREEFEHFGYAIQSIKERIAAVALPIIIKLGEWLTQVAGAVVNFTKTTNVLETAMIAISAFVSTKVVGTLGALAEALGLVRATALETLAAFAEFLLPVAAVTALYLLFDDFYTLMTGGKSVIGDVLDKLFGIGTAKKFVVDIKEAFSALIDVLKNVGDAVLQTLIYPIERAFDALKGIGGALGDIASGEFKKAWADLGAAGNEMAADFQKRADKISADMGHAGQDFTLSKEGRKRARVHERVVAGDFSDYAPGGSEFSGPRSVPFRTVHTSPGHAGGVHQVVHAKIDVHTKSDKPHEVGAATQGGVERGLHKTAANTLDSRTEP